MNIDAIFNMHKVRFAKLAKLFKEVEVKSVISSVNVFINIEAIYHMFHNTPMEESIISMDKQSRQQLFANIISNTINLAAHYRLFFTRNKVKSNIVFYFNIPSPSNDYNNSSNIDGYRGKYAFDYNGNCKYELINSYLSQAIPMIKSILDYIDGVYFITSNRIEASLIPHLIVEEGLLDGQLNIMVSKDMYDLQYVNKNFLLIYPYKDDTNLITESNLFDIIKDKEGCKVPDKLPAYLYPFMLSVFGDKRRNVPKIRGVGFSSIYKNIAKIFNKLEIGLDEYVSFEQLALCIKESHPEDNSNKTLVYNNYMSVDLDRQLSCVPTIQKNDISSQMIDKFDNVSLKEINEKYFEMSPIHIMELENYTPKKYMKDYVKKELLSQI